MTLYPGGHKLRPFLLETELDFLELDPSVAHMFCRNCQAVDPEPGGECRERDF